MHLAENIHYLFSRYFCFLDHCLFRESSSYSCFLTKSSQGVESHLFTARSCCYQGSRVSEVCKPHNLVENAYPSRGFHFRVEKQNRCHLHIGAAQTLPALLNQSSRCRMWSRKHSQARIELQEEKNKTEHTARGPRLLLASPRMLGPFGQSPVPGRSGERAGLPPEPADSRPTLPGAFTGSLPPADWAPLVQRPFPHWPRL